MHGRSGQIEGRWSKHLLMVELLHGWTDRIEKNVVLTIALGRANARVKWAEAKHKCA